jgi:hypothetical protein
MADTKARRAAFTIPAPDPANLAAAMERQEIRAHIRTLKPAERLPFALQSKDQRIVAAAAAASAFNVPKYKSRNLSSDFVMLGLCDLSVVSM